MHFHVICGLFYSKIAEIFWRFPQTSYDSSFLLVILHLHRGRDFCRFNVFCSRLNKVISKDYCCSDLAYFHKRFEFSKKISCGWKNKISQFAPQVKDKDSYRVQMAIHSRWKNLNKKSERIMISLIKSFVQKTSNARQRKCTKWSNNIAFCGVLSDANFL